MRRARRALLATLLALAAAAPARAASPAEWISPSDPILRDVELLRAAGLADTAVTATTFPLARRQVAAVTARARRLHPDSRDPSLVRLEREFGRELVDRGFPAPPGFTAPLATWTDAPEDSGGAPGTRARLWSYATASYDLRKERSHFADRSRFGGRLNVERGGLLLHLDVYAGRLAGGRRFTDQLVTGSDFLAYSEDSYASWSGGGMDLTLGRTALAFGPGTTGQLLWSSTADPLTLFTFSTTLFRHVRATAVAGDVDASDGERVAAHRLEWFPSDALSVGLGEAARYHSTTLEPLYVLSLLPYTFVQRMLDHDRFGRTTRDTVGTRNNVEGALDVSWRIRPGATLYGELFLDDQNLRTAGSPTRLGYQAGALLTRAVGTGRAWLRGEFTRVHRYVYRVYYGEDFVLHGRPIGYPLGPDSRNVHLEARWAPAAAWEVGALADRQDVGELGLREFFDPAGPPAAGSTFGGVVERTDRVGASLRAYPRDGVDVSVAATHASIANAGHVAGASRDEWTGRLGVRLRY